MGSDRRISMMPRAEAIERIARADLAGLSEAARIELLDVMMCEDWTDQPGWAALPREVRDELERGERTRDAGWAGYAEALLLSARGRYAAATSAHLITRLAALGIEVGALAGEPALLEPCPCCGRRTLGSRGDYGICRVCWWEDDGQDNERATVVEGGPNGRTSLAQARLHFLTTGIYDPARVDLRPEQDPPEMYAPGRVFTLGADGCTVTEPAAGWSATLPRGALPV